MIKKIKEYIKNHKNNYVLDCNLNKFLDQNPDIRCYLEQKLKNEPWFENIKNILVLLNKGVDSKIYCKNCGKLLSIKSIKNGSIKYCSGSCKGKDELQQKKEKQNKQKKEEIYFVDLNKKYPQFFNNVPNDIIKHKINMFYLHDKRGIGLYNFLNQNEDVNQYLTNLVLMFPQMKNKKIAFWYAKNEIYQLIKCKKCGKFLSFLQVKNKCVFCSSKCTQLFQETKNKIKETNQKKYGVDCVLSANEIKEKIKKTNKKRFNSINAASSIDVKEKVKQTNIQKYGVECYFHSNDYKEKNKETNQKKYGVDCILLSNEIKEKIKKTNLNKYGVENVFQNNEVKKRLKISRYKSFYHEIVNKYKNYVEPMFSEEQYQGIANQQVYKWKCKKCNMIFDDYKRTSSRFRRFNDFPLCPNCYPPISGFSYLEEQVLDFVKLIYNGEIIENDRKILNGKQLDIVLPELKLAIQFNGVYWHSLKDKNYHLMKTELCESKGYRLIHIWQNQWIKKQDVVKKMIKLSLGIYDKVINAYDCELKYIEDIDNFLEENYLGNKFDCDKSYGLYHKDELISIIMINKANVMKIVSNMSYDIENIITRIREVFLSDFNDNVKIEVDRRYENKENYKDLELREEREPQIIKINNYEIYDCGSLIYNL